MNRLKEIYAWLTLSWIVYSLLFVDASVHGTRTHRASAFLLTDIILPVLGLCGFVLDCSWDHRGLQEQAMREAPHYWRVRAARVMAFHKRSFDPPKV